MCLNNGMGLEVNVNHDALIGIFRSEEEIKTYLTENGYLGWFTEDRKLEQRQKEYIIENWYS
jgi:hypothetical protein